MLYLKLLLSLSLLLLLTDAPVAWRSDTTHDFGPITRGEPVYHTFYYHNRGDEPLVIDNVRVACGCTSPDWSTRPVAPDSLGQLRVRFDARTAGYFRKYVKVYFRGQRQAERLWLEGEVMP